MLDLILLGFVSAAAVLFGALTLDEVTRLTVVRRSSPTSLLPPIEVANQPTAESVPDDREKEAA